MSCEKYREALIEAAAQDSSPSRELQSHLDACASCRAAFAQEVQLLGSIDAGLRIVANAEVPASLLLRVRANLGENPVRRRSWLPALAALAAAAVIVMAVVLARGSRPDATVSNPNTNSAGRAVVASRTQPAPVATTPSAPPRPSAKHERIGLIKSAPIVQAEEVRVLIPRGQKQAIDALLAGVQNGRINADVLAAQPTEQSLQQLQLPPLEISPIELKPLTSLRVEPDSRSEEAGR
ncbi:MAG: hypothetical protein WCE61_22320 [Candidatus Acidiferrum sp.]